MVVLSGAHAGCNVRLNELRAAAEKENDDVRCVDSALVMGQAIAILIVKGSS